MNESAHNGIVCTFIHTFIKNNFNYGVHVHVYCLKHITMQVFVL